MPDKHATAPFALLLLVFCIWGCANPVPPTGGPEDNQPPQVVESKPQNLSTNFTGKEIRITFDEWVQLRDVFTQVVVSPPQEEAPTVKLKGKTVILTFQDSLRANTTYTIYFGESVKDITKNNSAKDLRYVISTGPYIDSLSMGGVVADAETGDRAEDILVMLYKNTSDSIVYKSKPDYFAKTDESGSYTIENIGSGDYKVFALKDQNFNYRYDLGNELIGFLPELVNVNDSLPGKADLLLFQEKLSLKLLSTTGNNYGKVRFDFNSSPIKLQIRAIGETEKLDGLTEIKDESAWFWYDAPSMDSIEFELSNAGNVLDTVLVRLPSRSVFLKKKARIELAKETTGKKENTGKANLSKGKASVEEKASSELLVNPTRPFYLNFNFPITAFESSDFSLVEDSTGKEFSPKITQIADFPRRLEVDHQWKATSYTLTIKQGSLGSICPINNAEISVTLIAKDAADFGNILTKIYGLNPSESYIVDLLDQNDATLETHFINGLDSTKRDYMGLEQGSYKLRLVEDKNKNSQWDPGNYLEKVMPERIVIKPLPKLKPNWDVEGIIDISQANNKIQAGKNRGITPK